MPAIRITPLLFALLLCAGCDSAGSSSGDLPSGLVQLEVHFQGGMAGEGVLLEIDGQDLFRGTLSLNAPFSGPVAVVSEDLTQGAHRLRVTVFSDSGEADIEAELDINLSGPLYVGVGFDDESRVVALFASEDPFMYQ